MKTLARRNFLQGAALLAGANGAPAFGAPRKRPNILFIMTDEMRWNVLGCEGHPVVRTPHLDRLAAQGTRFATAYTVAPICCPSRQSAFSSRYPQVHGVLDNGSLPNDGEIRLPTILKHYGYHTGISGKLHYDPEGPDYDFDMFWSYLNEGPGRQESYPKYLQRKHGNGAVHPAIPGSCPFPDDPLGRDIGKFPYPKEDFESFWVADRAIDYLRSRKGTSAPWFLFTSFLVPHSPYRTPEPYHSMYDPKTVPVYAIPEQAKRERAAAIERDQKGAMRHLVDNEPLLRALTAQYFGHVTNVDDNVGRLLGELQRLGMDENTIVVFTADHGNMLGEKGRFFKGVMYEGSSRIPMMMRCPATVAGGAAFRGGRVVKEIVENIDIMPTLLDLAGLPVPDNGIQGKSMVRLTAGKDPAWKNRAFSFRTQSMVRTPEWKLITGKGRRGKEHAFELYDMHADPGEERDLANEPKFQPVVEKLASAEAEWWKMRAAPPRIAGLKTPDWANIPAKIRDEYKTRKRVEE